MDPTTFIITLSIFLLSVSIHESAHAYAAFRLGDDTAARLGRISLNPLRHIDPIMTIVVPVVLLLTVGVPFGGAKPVPIIVSRLRDPRRDMMWIAWAGPASNVVQALFFAALWFAFVGLHVAVGFPGSIVTVMAILCQYGIFVNLILGGFNMIPVPPLDGSRILAALVPESVAASLDQLERMGLFIVFALIMLGVTDYFLRPLELVAQLLVRLPGMVF